MATSAKKKAAQREKEALQANDADIRVEAEKRCTCLVAIRGRGEHAIGCALY